MCMLLCWRVLFLCVGVSECLLMCLFVSLIMMGSVHTEPQEKETSVSTSRVTVLAGDPARVYRTNAAEPEPLQKKKRPTLVVVN